MKMINIKITFSLLNQNLKKIGNINLITKSWLKEGKNDQNEVTQ